MSTVVNKVSEGSDALRVVNKGSEGSDTLRVVNKVSEGSDHLSDRKQASAVRYLHWTPVTPFPRSQQCSPEIGRLLAGKASSGRGEQCC